MLEDIKFNRIISARYLLNKMREESEIMKFIKTFVRFSPREVSEISQVDNPAYSTCCYQGQKQKSVLELFFRLLENFISNGNLLWIMI